MAQVIDVKDVKSSVKGGKIPRVERIRKIRAGARMRCPSSFLVGSAVGERGQSTVEAEDIPLYRADDARMLQKVRRLYQNTVFRKNLKRLKKEDEAPFGQIVRATEFVG